MRKIFYLFSFVLAMIFTSSIEAQYHITGYSWLAGFDSLTFCNPPVLYVTLDSYASTLTVKTYYGNGRVVTTPVVDGGTFGYSYCYSNYAFPGHYTTKAVLYSGSAPVDSIEDSHEYLFCSTTNLKCVYDSLGTGIFDEQYDHGITIPITIEIDHNGIPIDTITTISGSYYSISGTLGDVYSYKIIDVPTSLILTFPASGVIYDTIKNPSNNTTVNYFGFKCSGVTGFDAGLFTINSATRGHRQVSAIYPYSTTCNPVDAAITVNFSPKYKFMGSANPIPTSTTPSSLTWVIPGLTMLSNTKLQYTLSAAVAGTLLRGDTVQSYFSIIPTTGDIDPTNNSQMVVDTVTSSHDPNEMSVSPPGNILAGTKLRYTVNFENTGNDTAFNVSIYDTLSDNVDIKSLNMVMASSDVNIAILNKGEYNIVRFDFPNINLPDSSHHNQCDGGVIFTVNAKDGLADGTAIFNHAGIFFDYNPVVMTNTVENIIGFPNSVANVDNTSKVSVYPNPAKNEVIIKTENGAYSTASFTDVLGRQVLAEQISGTQAKVNVSKLSPGMYYITLRGESGVKVMKFEKTN